MRNQFGDFLLQRSKALRLTRTELARRANLSRESFYKLMRGEIANPTIQTLYGLAVALEVSPLFLLRQYFSNLNLGTPTVLPVRQPGDHVSFVRDVTIPDNTAVGLNQRLKKTWEIQNTGRVAWRSRHLVCCDDDFVLARRTPDGGLQEIANCHLRPVARSVPVPDIAPGESAYLSVEFIAPPIPCTVMSLWKIVDDRGATCFPEFSGIWVKVRVVGL